MYFVPIYLRSCDVDFFRALIRKSGRSYATIMYYLQGLRPCPISMSRPVILLIKVVFPAPVMPMTAIRIDVSVKFGGSMSNFGVQSLLITVRPS
jgi:hypothetical protein